MKLKVTKEIKEIIDDLEKIEKVNILGLELKIQKYIPIQSKIALATKIAESGLSSDNKKYSQIVVHSIKKAEILATYTDLEFNDDFLLDYDILSQTSFYEEVLKYIPSREIEELNELIDKKIEDIKRLVSKNNSIDKFLDNILSIAEELLYSIEKLSEDGKIDEIMGTLVNSIEKLDPDKLTYVNEFLKAVGVDNDKG